MDGKLFLCGNITPPAIPQKNTCDFVFDLQRFVVTDASWAVDTVVSDGKKLTTEDINGYDTQGEHKIKVVNGSTTKYFDYMQSAMNFVLGNQTGNATSNDYGNNYSADGATITLLGDIENGDAFTVGRTRASGTGIATKVTLDLNDKKYLFGTALVGSAKDGGTVEGLGKDKAIATAINASSSLTIKNGTMGIANGSTAVFERFLRSYIDVTLDNLTLDATSTSAGFPNTNLKADDIDSALIDHTAGTLNIINGSKIIAPDGNYYAVAGKLAATGDNSSYANAGFTINVGSGTEISNIGLYNWNDSNATGFGKGALSIGGGTVGELVISEGALTKGTTGAMHNVTIDSGAVVNKITYPTDNPPTALAYAESADPVMYNQESKAQNKGLVYTVGQAGWNADTSTDQKYNFVAASVGAADSLKAGQVVISATGVTTAQAANLGFDSANSVIAVPTVATAAWGTSSDTNANYAVVAMNYNGSQTKVTLGAVSLGSSEDDAYAKLVAKVDASSAGLFAETVEEIDASKITVAASIVGNAKDNTIYGGTVNDTLTGGSGADVFYYSAGADVITDYAVGYDKVALTDTAYAPTGAEISATSAGLVLTFDEGKTLTFNGQGSLTAANALPSRGVTVDSGKKSYVYTTYSVADFTNGNANGITLASGYATNTFAASNPFATIDASAVTVSSINKLDITGLSGDNYIIAASAGGALNGNGGNDTLVGGKGADTFVFNSGKVVIEGYSTGDSVSMNASAVTGVKASGNKLIFSTNNSSNTLTINPVNNKAVTAVSLTSGEVLGKAGSSKDGLLTLFQDAKGSIEAAEYNATTGIDASKVKSHSVTLVGATGGGTYTFADNKKADVFQYSGGAAIVKGYESGRDKINLDDFEMTKFTVGSGDDNNVTLTANGTGNTIVIEGAKGKEINFRDGNSKGSAYTSMVLAGTGVVHDKETNPTRATLLSGVTDYTAVNDKTIKKVYVDSGLTGGVSITANESKMTVDAGDAVAGVSIIGGTGDNKVTLGGGADIYEYHGGKDIVTGFSTGDSISLSDFDSQLLTAKKITVGKSDVTFKFDSSNSLNVKGVTNGVVQFVDKSMTFANNAIIDSDAKRASLTSGFTGSYKTDSSSTYVDGTNVEKSLTFKGTSSAETLIGGAKKTTFRGGGGADSLVGGTGSDTFFYAKGDRGEAIVANFDYANDKIKIANGTITKIENATSGVKFTMNNGKGTSNIGSFSLNSYSNNGTETAIEDPNKIVIKANNTYYWFATADDDDLEKDYADGSGKVQVGDLITDESRVKASAIPDTYKVVDLSYSTNLVKAGVAHKVSGATIGATKA